jgi:hypothetical protein
MEGMTPAEIDLAGTDGGLHARLAQSLIDAAKYIRTHPDLPIPADVEIRYCIPAGTDKDGEDELHRIAAMLGAHVTGDDIGEAGRDFGPVRYSATYVSRGYMGAYLDHMASHETVQAERRAAAAKSVAAIKDIARETSARIQPRGEAA